MDGADEPRPSSTLTADEVVDRGYPEAVVARIVHLQRANRFKRRLVLIARLSGSAINPHREIPRV